MPWQELSTALGQIYWTLPGSSLSLTPASGTGMLPEAGQLVV
jgi:hypothetical protein